MDSGTTARKLTSNPDGRYSREWIVELGGFKRYLRGLNNQDWRLFWDTAEKGKVGSGSEGHQGWKSPSQSLTLRN